MKCHITDDLSLSRPLEGPLAADIGRFAQWAREQGYARSSRYKRILLSAGLSRWLGDHRITACQIASEHPRAYLKARARGRPVRRADRTVLDQFMAFLRDQGVIPPRKSAPRWLTPVEQEVQAFETYLRQARAVSDGTVGNYLRVIRPFLTQRFGSGRVRLSGLCADDVVGFVQREIPRLSVPQAKQLTTALRSFLQYVRYRGDVVLDLAAAVPVVASWSMAATPRAIPPDAVRQLLASMPRRTPTERRDYAVVVLLADLGLRAGEVAGLELEDLDWNIGQLRVRGKGGHWAVLPLPLRVGEAIVAYLRDGRPPSPSRRVFLRASAPRRGLQGSAAISAIVRRALQDAGVQAPTNGAHQFRHALATQMLRHGASLREIGDVLRHRRPQTTTIYAKVDLAALRSLALPWPGGLQ
ncbi:MAG: integrase [Acidobacteria bacterium]|nr:MAG: integrase [Acidobacteriota bacterium]